MLSATICSWFAQATLSAYRMSSLHVSLLHAHAQCHVPPFRYNHKQLDGPCGMGPKVRLASNGKLRPDVYIAPEDSLVAEIKASEIVPSDVTSAGLAC